MKNILDFKGWVRMNEATDSTDSATKNQIATPNYWFSNIFLNGSTGSGKSYNIECPEKEKVTSYVTGLTGLANRTQTPLQCTIPNAVKGYDNIKSFLETGKVGEKVYFDPTKGQAAQKSMVGAPIAVYNNSVDMPMSQFVKIMNGKKSWLTGKDKYGKPYSYGVNAEGVTTLWELMCKMIEKLNG